MQEGGGGTGGGGARAANCLRTPVLIMQALAAASQAPLQLAVGVVVLSAWAFSQ